MYFRDIFRMFGRLASKARNKPALARTPNDAVAVGISIITPFANRDMGRRSPLGKSPLKGRAVRR